MRRAIGQRKRSCGKPKKKTGQNHRFRSGRFILRGILYCNELECRVAKLLADHQIEFEYSKKFETTDRDGNPNHREVDFWLKEPVNIFWCNEPLQAIEVKGGGLDDRSWEQRRELDAIGVKTWIALPQYVSFWERYGFLRDIGIRDTGKRKR